MPKEDCSSAAVLVLEASGSPVAPLSAGGAGGVVGVVRVSWNSVLSCAMILLLLLSSEGGAGRGTVSARLHSSLAAGLAGNGGVTGSSSSGGIAGAGSLFSKDSHGNCNREATCYFFT